nr:glycosyltransferase [Pectobacterium aquaticum]
MYFNKDVVVTDTIRLNNIFSSDKDNSSFNIAYGIDKNFMFGCGISIASILLHNKEMKFTFHIFTDHCSPQNIHDFKKLSEQYNTTIIFYVINCEELKTLPSTKNWSYATYFRFIIADFFYNFIDKVLYLDADIICKGKLTELEKLDLDNYLAAVVTEGEQVWWEKRANALGDDNIRQGYFNAGFLLINIHQWGKEDISSQAMKLLSSDEVKKKISFLDQDILNILFVRKVKFLSKDYNKQYSINYELKCKKNKEHSHDIKEETIFIHYIGPTKPWHEWATPYPNFKYFQKAKEHSPWRGYPLQKAESVNQLRYCSKHLFHQGNFLYSLFYFMKYIKNKLKNKLKNIYEK